MRAGLLREILVFKELVKKTSLTGAEIKEYVPVYTCKAYKKKQATVANGDGLNAKEQFINILFIFQVRYHPLIKDNQRVEFQGRDYAITLLDMQRDNTYLVTLNKVDE